MKIILTICSRRKKDNPELLAAGERYIGSHIASVKDIADRLRLPMFFLSGKYGLLSIDTKIPYYDTSLEDAKIGELAHIIAKQLQDKKITDIEFYVENNDSWTPYKKVISAAIKESGGILREHILLKSRRKVLLLPGWMTALKLYKDNDDFDIKIGNLDEDSAQANYVIGLSLGALVVLQNVDRINGKIILINPALPKRNLLTWFIHWVKFITTDGLFFERQKFTKNPIKFIATVFNCIKLLNADFSKQLDAIKDRLTIICGKNDKYFCDNKAVEFINLKGIKLIEVEGGHNWSEEVEKALLVI